MMCFFSRLLLRDAVILASRVHANHTSKQLNHDAASHLFGRVFRCTLSFACRQPGRPAESKSG